MNQHAYAKQAQPIHMSGSENRNGHSEGKAGDETAAVAAAVVAAAVGLTAGRAAVYATHHKKDMPHTTRKRQRLRDGSLAHSRHSAPPSSMPTPCDKKKSLSKMYYCFYLYPTKQDMD